MVILLYGLSSTGKTTITKILAAIKQEHFVLDGNDLRNGSDLDSGLSKEDRIENFRQIMYYARSLAEAGEKVLVASVTPYREMREIAREICSDVFCIEVYLSTLPEEYEKRDTKDKIKGMTGIDDPSKILKNPRLVLSVGKMGIEESVSRLLSLITFFESYVTLQLMKRNNVLCQKCGKSVGQDSQILEIECCSLCLGKKNLTIRTAQSSFARTKNGPASELPGERGKVSFRSLWERNFARCLEVQGFDWTYEKNVFTFNGVIRRPFQYIPDFYDLTNDILWEVKGFLRSQDRSRIKRFRKYYPEDFKKLKVLCSKGNKTTRGFFEGIGVPCEFIEDWKEEWEEKVQWE